MNSYINIRPSGEDTGAPLNLSKRLRLISSQIPLSSSRILDAGCGSGLYVSALSEAGSDVYGVEFCSDKVKNFKSNHPDIAHKVTTGDIEQLNFPNDFFDAVILNEVLEHISSIEKSLPEVHRVLRDNGKLIIFSPNRLYPLETHAVTIRRTNTKIPHGTPLIPYIPLSIGLKFFKYEARNFWPHELRSLIQRYGFNVIRSKFIAQTFENISGKQPVFLKYLRPILRSTILLLEHIPIINSITSVSQMYVEKKVRA